MAARTRVWQQGAEWEVEVVRSRGSAVHYRYRWERQARYFAAVFSLDPSWMPVPERLAEEPRSEGFPDIAEALQSLS